MNVAQIRKAFSGAPSMWLRLIASFFKLFGVLFAVMAVSALVALVRGLPPPPGHPSVALTLLILSAIAGALMLTGVLLARRERAGAYIALVLSFYPLAFVLAGERALSWSDVVATLVTLVVVASIWPQLSARRGTTAAK